MNTSSSSEYTIASDSISNFSIDREFLSIQTLFLGSTYVLASTYAVYAYFYYIEWFDFDNIFVYVIVFNIAIF